MTKSTRSIIIVSDADMVKCRVRQQVAHYARYRSGEVLTPFFDTNSIKDMDDWEHHILRGLQESRLFLVILSPGWFKSPLCRRELRQYLERQARHRLSGDHVGHVHLIKVPDLAENWIDDPGAAEEVAWCRRQLFQAQARMEPWFPSGEDVLADEVVLEKVGRIAERVMPSVQDRLDRFRLAEAVKGNVRAVSPTFVGRGTYLRELHAAAALSAPGTVALLHGPGGFGKTELAVAYANNYRHEYGAGVWQVAAQGRSDLLAAIGTLARDLEAALTNEERTDEALAGRAVLRHLRARILQPMAQQAPSVRQAALLVLDNLDDTRLFAVAQRDQVNAQDWEWLRVVATTKLAPDEFAGVGRGIVPLESGPLSEAESLELLREHQPVRGLSGVHRFRDAEQESAAREIVQILGGVTLAVEQVAVHLGLGHGVPPQHTEPVEYLARLRVSGVLAIDQHVIEEGAEFDALRHQEPIMAYVMDTALAELPDDAAVALRISSLFPADSVPWPWVVEIAQRSDCHLPPDRIRQILTGRRLLISTPAPEILRIHRLHAKHLAESAGGAGCCASSLSPRGWRPRRRVMGRLHSDGLLLPGGRPCCRWRRLSLLPGASEPDNGTHQRGLAVGLVDWELCRERSGQPVSIGQWTEACQLWIGLAELRTLQQEEEQYLHLACSRSFRDTASK